MVESLKSSSRTKSTLGLAFFATALCAAPAALSQSAPEPGAQGAPSMQQPAFQMGRPGISRGRMGRPVRPRAMGDRRGGRRAAAGLLAMLRRPEVRQEVGLTDDQIRKLDDIAFNAEKARLEEQKNVQVRRLELRRLMQSESPDRGSIDRKLQELSQSQLALARAAANARLDGRAVLSKQQRDKLAQYIQRARSGRRGVEPGSQRPPAGQSGPPPAQPPR